MAKVAFLGLGVMGYPMAGHLKNKGGHDLTVYNRTIAKAEKWTTQHGGTHKATPKEAAAGLVFPCLRVLRHFCTGSYIVSTYFVMAGLVPAIHVFYQARI